MVMRGAAFRSFFFYIFLSLFLIFLDSRLLLSPVYKSAQSLTVPVKTRLVAAANTLSRPASLIRVSINRSQDLEKLKKENNLLLASLARLQALEEENRQLRHLLGSPLPSSWKFSPARVVGREGDILVVSATSPAGTPVVLPAVESGIGGILVGKVQEVRGRETRIMLTGHPESRIPAFTRSPAGKKAASGILMGEAGGAVLDQVLTSEELKAGDLVLSSGDGSLPPDLLLGRVEEEVAAGGTWKRAKVKVALEEIGQTVFFVTEY